MRIKNFLKRLVSIGVAVIVTVTLVGCFDLGGFSDESAYYDAFGKVRLVHANAEKVVTYEEYDVKDYFYNKNTGENFTYGDPKDSETDEEKDIPQLPYAYMAIPVTRALEIESVGLYFQATQSCSLEVFFYVVDELPDDGEFTNIRLLGEPEFQPELDGNGKPMTDKDGNPIYKVYTDPAENLMVGKATTYLKDGKWVSLLIDTWNSGNVAQVTESQYLLLRFMNNGGAGTAENPSVDFRVTNLLICAVS